jgi:hypothetical protein
VSADSKPPPRWLLAWEALPGQTQAAIAFPVLFLLLFLLHITLFNQPFLRSVLYGIFWSVLGTYAVVMASRTEAAKRGHRNGGSDER